MIPKLEKAGELIKEYNKGADAMKSLAGVPNIYFWERGRSEL